MFDAAPARICRAWNKGLLVGPKLALKPKQVWAVRFHLKREGRLRDLAMFDLAIDSKLRGCDLVQLRIGDLLSGGVVRARALVTQQKTGRPVQFEVTQGTRESVIAWVRARGGRPDEYLFPSRRYEGRCITTRQYARLLKKWLAEVGIEPSAYGTHSLRRTKVALIYGRPATFAPCRSCSVTPSSIVPYAISASTLKTRSRSPKQPTSNKPSYEVRSGAR